MITEVYWFVSGIAFYWIISRIIAKLAKEKT